MTPNACLILEDGSVWPGYSFGAPPPKAKDLTDKASPPCGGEVVFNTGMTGYPEILTDPSYTGQIVTMTHPHIGNYGYDRDWSESSSKSASDGSIMASGLVVRALHRGPVPGERMGINELLAAHGICGISGVDTRGLTIELRSRGSRNGLIIAIPSSSGLTDQDFHAAMACLRNIPGMQGRNLCAGVGILSAETINPEGRIHVALLDCGVKKSIIDALTARDCRVTLLPLDTEAAALRALAPDALLFSNGPGDPQPLEGQAELARQLMGELPLWGICLGLQILARALGGSTYKMTFGHHGLNHPVRDEKNGRVLITSQNHGFAVDEKTLPPGCEVSFRHVNDGTVEGIEDEGRGLFSVQHHPEAAPGPSDSAWVFDSFLKTLKEA